MRLIYTQKQAHTLDLVLSLGLPVLNMETCDAVFSLLCLIYFYLTAIFLLLFQHPIVVYLTHLQQNYFLVLLRSLRSPLGDGAEQMTSNFYDKCQTVLDEVAPFKTVKPQSDPWINEAARSAGRESRKAERKWKQMQVCF